MNSSLTEKGYTCLDVISGELTCIHCGYQVFNKKKMTNHLVTKHRNLYGAPTQGPPREPKEIEESGRLKSGRRITEESDSTTEICPVQAQSTSRGPILESLDKNNADSFRPTNANSIDESAQTTTLLRLISSFTNESSILESGTGKSGVKLVKQKSDRSSKVAIKTESGEAPKKRAYNRKLKPDTTTLSVCVKSESMLINSCDQWLSAEDRMETMFSPAASFSTSTPNAGFPQISSLREVTSTTAAVKSESFMLQNAEGPCIESQRTMESPSSPNSASPYWMTSTSGEMPRTGEHNLKLVNFTQGHGQLVNSNLRTVLDRPIVSRTYENNAVNATPNRLKTPTENHVDLEEPNLDPLEIRPVEPSDLFDIQRDESLNPLGIQSDESVIPLEIQPKQANSVRIVAKNAPQKRARKNSLLYPKSGKKRRRQNGLVTKPRSTPARKSSSFLSKYFELDPSVIVKPRKSFWIKEDEAYKSKLVNPAPGFHCKDLIFKELTCNLCYYTEFSRRTMAFHVNNKHLPN